MEDTLMVAVPEAMERASTAWRKSRAKQNWSLVAVLLLASGLRLWRLGVVPPGFQFDEAYNAIDAAHVLHGQFDLFFPANGGREPLLVYLQALFLALLGRDYTVPAIRLVSALIGITTVAVTYRFVVDVFGNRRLALLTSLFLAISYWHVHFSRYAIRAILAPLWTTLVIWTWWQALHHSTSLTAIRDVRTRTAKWSQWIMQGKLPWLLACGVFLAAAVYSHPTGRLVPLILVGHTLYRSVPGQSVKPSWGSLVIVGGTAFLLFLPLAWLFIQNPALFTDHPNAVSLSVAAKKSYHGNLLSTLIGQVQAILGMFSIAGDPSAFHNLPGLPVFDPLSATLAVVGLGVALSTWFRSWREQIVLLGLWLVVMLLPTILSDRAPNFSRAIASLPVIVLLPPLGLCWLLKLRLSSRVAGYRLPLVAGFLLFPTSWTIWHYFVSFAALPGLYYSYDVDKVDAYHSLVAQAEKADVFLGLPWIEQSTIAYLNADGPIRVLDATDTLVFPADGRDIVVAFPAGNTSRPGWLAHVERLYDSAGVRSDILDAYHNPLLITYYLPRSSYGDLVPPTDAPLEPSIWSEAEFGGIIRLIGYTIGDARPGKPLPLTFVWQSRHRVGKNLTVFVHLLGEDGRWLGQEDREPGHKTYRTSSWQPGDVVMDHYEPMLAPDASGIITAQIGWYDAQTGGRLTVGDSTEYRLAPIQVPK